jgi:hypothetical protein
VSVLDFAYRREQLYFEILLDVRDAMEQRPFCVLCELLRKTKALMSEKTQRRQTR